MDNFSKFEKISESISSFLLIIAGLFGLIVGTMDFVGWEYKFLKTGKEPIYLILLIVGVLSLSYGIERTIRFRKLDQQFQKFESLITSSLGAQFLISYRVIYSTSIRLCSQTQNRIRILSIGPTSNAPKDWIEAVARRLKESKKAGNAIKYECAIIVDFDNLSPDFSKNVEKRNEIFNKYGVKDLVKVYLVNQKPSIGFDLLIIDRAHLAIGFNQIEGIKQLQRAISFENQSKLASASADWYDEVIIQQAVPYETWLSNNNRLN